MLFMQNQTADGPSDEIQHFGGTVQIQVSGVFNGATATLQVSQDGLAFVSLDETPAIFTAEDVNAFTMLQGANKLIVSMDLSGFRTGAGNQTASFRITIDGTPIGSTGMEIVVVTRGASLTIESSVLTAGAHTVLLEWKITGATLEINASSTPDHHASMYVQEVSV